MSFNLFYISLLSKSIYCTYKENNQYAEWSSFHGADGYELQTVKIKHNMNGIVKQISEIHVLKDMTLTF